MRRYRTLTQFRPRLSRAVKKFAWSVRMQALISLAVLAFSQGSFNVRVTYSLQVNGLAELALNSLLSEHALTQSVSAL